MADEVAIKIPPFLCFLGSRFVCMCFLRVMTSNLLKKLRHHFIVGPCWRPITLANSPCASRIGRSSRSVRWALAGQLKSCQQDIWWNTSAGVSDRSRDLNRWSLNFNS